MATSRTVLVGIVYYPALGLAVALDRGVDELRAMRNDLRRLDAWLTGPPRLTRSRGHVFYGDAGGSGGCHHHGGFDGGSHGGCMGVAATAEVLAGFRDRSP